VLLLLSEPDDPRHRQEGSGGIQRPAAQTLSEASGPHVLQLDEWASLRSGDWYRRIAESAGAPRDSR